MLCPTPAASGQRRSGSRSGGEADMLTVPLLKRLYGAADDRVLEFFAEQSDYVLGAFGISSTRNRMHFFLAQIGPETGGLKRMEERQGGKEGGSTFRFRWETDN